MFLIMKWIFNTELVIIYSDTYYILHSYTQKPNSRGENEF